jgi:hypothetical protein
MAAAAARRREAARRGVKKCGNIAIAVKYRRRKYRRIFNWRSRMKIMARDENTLAAAHQWP